MQEATSAADDVVGDAIDVGRGGKDEWQQQEEQRQRNRHTPWQIEWKHPQWITSSSSSSVSASTETNESLDNDAQVVRITSARLSPSELSQILSFGGVDSDPSADKSSGKPKEDHQYLLTVTLLGQPAENHTESTTAAETEKRSESSLASEVLLEVLEVPGSFNGESASNQATTTTSTVVRSKRLRWPESIFDGSATNNSKPKQAAASARGSRSRRKTVRKRKNLLESVFLPLMGISEEDEYGFEPQGQQKATKRTASTTGAKEPSVGIVSATLCRRPAQDMLAKTKTQVTQDIVELMSFGTGFEEAGLPAGGLEDNKQQQTRRQNHEAEDCGELSFVCVSQAGEVFVYDPIKLLLGIEDESSLGDEEREAKKGLEEASSFFFGQDLFQNLQETWKPLAEPSNRIHLSLFEHDHEKHRSKKAVVPETSVEKTMVQSNQELSELAQSVASSDNKRTSGSVTDTKRGKQPAQHGTRHRGGGSSGDSVSTYHSDGDSIVTSATDALSVVQTMALELQTNVDEAISVLPYLLNPLLEPSTLKDRTIRNRPLDITVTGSSYVVVTGSGLRKKKEQKNWTKPGPSRDSAGDSVSRLSAANKSNTATVSPPDSPLKSSQHGSEAFDTNQAEASALSRKASGGDANTSEQEVLVDPFSDSIEERKRDGEETKNISPGANEEKWWENDNDADKEVKEGDSVENTNKLDDGDADKDGISIESVEDTTDLDINKNKMDGAAEQDAWWENDSTGKQEDGNGEKTSDSPMKHDEDSSQRHYFDGYETDNEGDDTSDRGGFVTFLSTARWSETRTLFLPFVPVRTSHISKWNDMELLWVIGEFETVLIRMDSTGPVPVRIGDIMYGREISKNEANLFRTSTASNRTTFTDGISNELSPLSVKKFQVLPIDVGATTAISPRLLCPSNTGINPPSILELHVDFDTRSSTPKVFEEEKSIDNEPLQQRQRYKQALVLLKTLGYCTPQGIVVLRHAPSHVAKIMVDQGENSTTVRSPSIEESNLDDSLIWAEQGQGWSLVGSNRHINFICWEGATLLQGAYVQELNHSPHSTSCKPFYTTHILPLSTIPVLSSGSEPSQNHAKKVLDESRSADKFQLSVSPTVDDKRQFPGDIFSPKGSNGTLSDLPKSTSLSRKQNSEYQLQQISSWTQLEDTVDDRIVLERQEPVLCLRSGLAESPHSVLSIRKVVFDNGISSPFYQVLAWLAKRKNFFVAAGIALDLLQDADSLYHLWKHAEMIDEEDEETKLIGLLDGIAPVRLLDVNNQRANQHNYSVTATHLSEMTVGCFIKGGTTMAKTLERFLENNKSYDPARVSLMLSLTTINLFSNERNIDTPTMDISPGEQIFEELLWPIKCLLSVGTEREYLYEVLELLNNTIPDELRHRHSEDEKEEEPSERTLTLTKKLIELILESDPVALEMLMGFFDDRSQTTFWQSLDHATRLSLFLMNVSSSFPFLRHPDARAWARGELDLCFHGQSDLPTTWLQELSLACLWNASCDLDDLRIVDDADDRLSETETAVTNDTKRSMDISVHKMKSEIEETRIALMPSTNKGSGIDYDLLIPTLLLLEDRSAHWLPSSQIPISSSPTKSSPSEELYVSTRSMLDASCYLAGRTPATTNAVPKDRSDEPYLFTGFDFKSAMKQCYRAKDVVAGAYLIGGTNGFVLHVSDVLNRGIGISIPDAESFLLDDRLNLTTIEECKAESAFELTDGHQKLLLLLDEHVLGIKTFGDFDFVHNRGRVDPVFAARSILRAWLSLSFGHKADASRWLGDWLGDHLEIRSVSAHTSTGVVTNGGIYHSNLEGTNNSDDDAKNPERDDDGKDSAAPIRHRLVCASLVRSLLWPNNKATPKTEDSNDDTTPSVVDEDSLPLAATMEFDKKLLIELCQSCMGLVESVPSGVVHEIKI